MLLMMMMMNPYEIDRPPHQPPFKRRANSGRRSA
jgi:hypothetical protein